MKTIYITEKIELQKQAGWDIWSFVKIISSGFEFETVESQKFQTEESALYHLCTNQIIWS